MVIYALYVVIEAAVLIIICKRSLREGMEDLELFDVTDQLVTSNQKIAISSRAQDINSKLMNKCKFSAAVSIWPKRLRRV